MPNDPRIGFLPEVSMGCTVSEEPQSNVIVNVAPPNPFSDLGPMRELSPGTWYATGEPHFVGAMPMRTELSILPSENDYPASQSPIIFEAPPSSEGQVLVSTGSGSEWGPTPSHLQIDPQGGVIHINHASSMNEGDIRFHMAGGLEVLRISANGDFFVRGNRVDNDHEIYQHFRKFLGMSFSLPAPDPRPRDGIDTRYERILKKCEGDQ